MPGRDAKDVVIAGQKFHPGGHRFGTDFQILGQRAKGERSGDPFWEHAAQLFHKGQRPHVFRFPDVFPQHTFEPFSVPTAQNAIAGREQRFRKTAEPEKQIRGFAPDIRKFQSRWFVRWDRKPGGSHFGQ